MATSSEATHDSSTDPDLRAELVVGAPVGGDQPPWGPDPDADTDPEPANVTLYYLPFEPSEPVRDLRFRLRQDDATPTFAEFVTHYRKAGEDRAASLGEVWRQWNAGSGGESEAFRAAEERSLSVGDIVVLDGEAHLCERIGWTRLGWDERDLRAARMVWLLADIHERVVAAASALAERIPGLGGNSRSDGAEDDP
jgi:hypothetical protein